MTASYYRPSGGISPAALPWAVLALPLIFGLSWVYAWLTFTLPFVYLNEVILFGYAFAIGVIVLMMPASAGKVRNPRAMLLISLLLGLFAWYAQWACWLAFAAESGRFPALGRLGLSDLLRQPQAVAAAMAEVYRSGNGTIASVTVSGAWLGVVWAVECLVIVGMAVFGGDFESRKPFSEKRGAWAEAKTLEHAFPYVSDPQAFAAEVGSQPLRLSEWLDGRSDDAERHAEVTLYLCRDGVADYLSISNVVKTADKGKEKKSSTTVLEYLSVPVWLTQPYADAPDAPAAGPGGDVPAAAGHA